MHPNYHGDCNSRPQSSVNFMETTKLSSCKNYLHAQESSRAGAYAGNYHSNWYLIFLQPLKVSFTLRLIFPQVGRHLASQCIGRGSKEKQTCPFQETNPLSSWTVTLCNWTCCFTFAASEAAIAEIARNVILNPFCTCDSFRSWMTAIILWQFSAVTLENVSDTPLFTNPNCSQLVLHLTYTILVVINCATCPFPLQFSIASSVLGGTS